MGYTAEINLLLDVIKPARQGESPPQAGERTHRTFDWDYINRCAGQNGVGSLFYHNLVKSGYKDSVPPHVIQELEKRYRGTGLRNFFYYNELKSVLGLFEKKGIRVIVLKGAALAGEVWNNVAVREMADIDILMMEKDLEKGAETLSGAGYVPYEGYRQKEWYLQNHHHLAPYYNPEKNIVIEIHRNISCLEKGFDLDVERIWKRAEAARFGDVRTEVLAPEDLIVHLCLHISRDDNFIGTVRNLADIVQVIECRGSEIDWECIIRESREQGICGYLYYPLYLAKECLDADIACHVLLQLKKGSNLNLFEDRLLKLIIGKNLLLQDSSFSFFPAPFIRSACRVLLRDIPYREKRRILLQAALNPENEFAGGDVPPTSESEGNLRRLSSLSRGISRVIIKSSGRIIRLMLNKVQITLAK